MFISQANKCKNFFLSSLKYILSNIQFFFIIFHTHTHTTLYCFFQEFFSTLLYFHHIVKSWILSCLFSSWLYLCQLRTLRSFFLTILT